MSTGEMQLQTVRSLAQDLLRDLEAVERQLGRPADEEIVYLPLKKAIDHCLAGLAELQISGSANRLPSSELWNVAGHFLTRGWLQNQARTKPRGYAGDHELLARIYENRLCDDPLGRLFDRYFQSQAAPQAVRNRMALAADWIVQSAATNRGPFRVAVIGSALGLEVRDALLELDPTARCRVNVTLLDLDPAAIEFASAQLQPLLAPPQLTAISTNLFRLPDRPRTAESLRGTDLLFCPGLFDYLNDTQAVAMLDFLYRQLAPRGRLIVFQFAPHNPSLAYMEWFANWYLTYRDAAEFRRLIDAAGLAAANVTFGAEPLGIDLFAIMTKS